MQDWDRLMMIVVGLGVAAYTGYSAWRLWGQRKKGAAVGAAFLAVATIVLPLVLLMFGG